MIGRKVKLVINNIYFTKVDNCVTNKNKNVDN